MRVTSKMPPRPVLVTVTVKEAFSPTALVCCLGVMLIVVSPAWTRMFCWATEP